MQTMLIDSDGVHRATFEGEEAIVGWFLEQDIQSSQKTCQAYIDALTAVQSGEAKEWEGTGNAFTVVASRLQTTIESEFSDKSSSVSTGRLVECLRAWLIHISA